MQVKSSVGNTMRGTARVLGRVGALLCACVLMSPPAAWSAPPNDGWQTYGRNAQHTALSSVATQPLEVIRWSTPVDLAPPDGTILIHYGSPLVTPGNTVIVPVKTGSTEGFNVEARRAANGALLWSATTDYILPPHSWTPSYSPVLTAANRVYFAGAGGTVYYRDTVDTEAPAASGQLAFFGMANYAANPASFNATVFINTPITADSAGNIYFGFRTSGTARPRLDQRRGTHRCRRQRHLGLRGQCVGRRLQHHARAAPGRAGPEQ